MAKQRVGGRVVYAPKNKQNQAQPALQDDDDDIVANADHGKDGEGVAYSDWLAMSDDEKANVIADALNIPTPSFVDDSDLQRLAIYAGINDKPTVLKDSDLDSKSGQELFRTVHTIYDSYNDITYTANDIIEQLRTGDITMYNGQGGTVHGLGIYSASSFGSSASYVNRSKYTSGNMTHYDQNRMCRMKIKSTAKVISESNADKLVDAERRANTKLWKAVKNSNSQREIIAVAKGYDIIKDNWSDYHMILNRGAVYMSDKTVNPKHASKWK